MEPTNSKSKSWENLETRFQGWQENCARWKKNVPFSGDRVNSFDEESVSSERMVRPVIETSVIQTRHEFQADFDRISIQKFEWSYRVAKRKTEKPVVCSLDSEVSSVEETQRHSSESEQIRILLERDKESRFADCQTEIRKHEFQAEYDTRSVQKVNERSSHKKKLVVLIKEANDADNINNFFMKSHWSKIGIYVKRMRKSQWNGRIEAISRFNIRHKCEKEIGRRSRHCPWTQCKDTRTAEWNQLHERFERFSRCWIKTQWTIPRYQSTRVFPTSSSSWWNVEPFYRQRAAKHLGHAWYIGKRLCKSSRVFFSTLSAGIESMRFS